MKYKIKIYSFLAILMIVCFSFSISCQTSETVKIEKNYINDSCRKIDIGGYSLYTRIYGKGSPTVIFESGSGHSSNIWRFVQPEIAKITRTFSYDRAGLGKSDKSPLQRSVSVQVHELRILLEKAGIKPPYIFVPNSYGAYISRLYTYMYPEEVAGIVFVDGTSEKLPEFIKETLSFLKFQFYKFSTRSYPDGSYNEFSKSGQNLKDASKNDGLRNTPIIVLTSDIRIMSKQFAGLITPENSPWLGWQKEMAAMSNKSKHYIIYGSGHTIHLDNPKIVIKAITKLIRNEYNWNEKPVKTEQIISLPPEKMKKFVGRYLYSTDEVLTIKEENGHFFAEANFPKVEIFPTSEQKIIMKEIGIYAELIIQPKPKNNYLIIKNQYAMDTIIVPKMDENQHTPSENLMLGKTDEAIAAYRLIFKEDPFNKSVSEDRLNSFGYGFINKSKFNDAIAILKLNTEFYPKSANAFDSLGEAYMKAGNKELAIKNYEKSLELNPQNTNAVEHIKK